MSLSNLDNLVKTGKLKIESFQEKEFRGLLLSGEVRLKDANNAALAQKAVLISLIMQRIHWH